jgi:hypothetical protein
VERHRLEGRGWNNGVTPYDHYLRWRDELSKAVDKTLYPMWWLDAEVAAGRIMVLATDHACILFDVKTYPSGAQDMNGLLAAGKLDDIVNTLIPAFCEIGRSLGCVGALIESREGWSKVLRTQDFQVFQVSVRKALNGHQQQEVDD